MNQLLVYLGIVRDPNSNPLTLPWWAWLLVGAVMAAVLGAVVNTL